MGNPNITRQQVRLLRQRTASFTNMSGDAAGDYLSATTSDVVRYMVIEKQKVRKVFAFTITGDTGNDKKLTILKAATLDQAPGSATTIGILTMAAANSVAGQGTHRELSPTSADFDAGEELVVQTTSGMASGEAYEIYAIVESEFEVDANLPGGKLTESS